MCFRLACHEVIITTRYTRNSSFIQRRITNGTFTCTFPPTLAEVQASFADWRKNKKHRRPIPEDLWTAAVRLSPEHSLHKISTALSLSYTDLKKRVKSDKTSHATGTSPSLEFIPLDISPTHPAECIVEMEHRNGNKMRMHFKGKAELDLQVFAESFWSRRA